METSQPSGNEAEAVTCASGKDELPRMHAEEFVSIRKRLALTQVELAKRLGVHFRTLQKWERGERSIPGPAILLLKTFK